MRMILTLCVLLSGYASAQTIPSAFPVEHISYLDSAGFTSSVEPIHARVVVVFSDGSCLWSSFPSRSCFLFERKLDAVGVEIKRRGWQLLGVDVGFRNFDVFQAYPINTRPTVMFFEYGQWVAQFEPDRQLNESWQDDLAARVLDFAKKP